MYCLLYNQWTVTDLQRVLCIGLQPLHGDLSAGDVLHIPAVASRVGQSQVVRPPLPGGRAGQTRQRRRPPPSQRPARVEHHLTGRKGQLRFTYTIRGSEKIRKHLHSLAVPAETFRFTAPHSRRIKSMYYRVKLLYHSAQSLLKVTLIP